MAVNSIGRTGYYGSTNFNARAVSNPRKTPIFLDPRTGEMTTWKPGIYDPIAEERSNRRKKLLTFLLLGGLAFIFRKKIFKGIDLIKALFKK